MQQQRIALVTGANKGLGKAVARSLGRLGCRVYLGSRDRALGEAAAEELAAEGFDVAQIDIDVTRDDSVQAAADALMRRHGRIDILINNAGVLRRRAAFETDAANMLETYDANVFGVVRVIHAMLPLVQASERPRIVNIASTSASLALASDPDTLFGRSDTIVAYASSKAAVMMLTVQYANAFRRSETHAHIKINTATPGHIATDLNGHAGTRTVEQGARVVIDLANLEVDGPSGGFFNDEGAIPW